MRNSCIRTAWGRVEFLLFALFRLFHFVFNLVQVDFGGWKQIYYIMLITVYFKFLIRKT